MLQTDIVDSTRLTEPLGDEKAAALWAAHDSISRALIRRWGGREIDKSDGFMVVFDAAADAVEFALDYHHGLATLDVPLQARAGLHVAQLTLIENTPSDVSFGAKPVEVRGLAVAITARLMSLAQGGQTLLTAEAKDALGATAFQVKGHGHWRLKGVREPVELFEVGRPGAMLSPPPDAPKAFRVVRKRDLWLPVAQLRHSLPAERDDFIGRADALDELVCHFDHGARLVSVLGIGGTGKTRLAQRFGWTYLGEFPGGVWFCDLSQARSLDGLIHAVAQGLDVPLGKGDPVAQLGAAIAGRGACLVILDNFEQVASLAESTVGRWLDRAGEARFIVTTREVLGIVGEQDLALAPLPPADGAELFVRRAAAAKAAFRPTADDTAAIEKLVRLLDGLPLAIELAAARVHVMSPRMLLTRMSERFKLLASRGGRIDRQATLEAAFDWSWDLLSPPEKSALAQLSVFEGGFTLAAAEALLDLSLFDAAPTPMDAVQSLAEKSLIRQVTGHRFGMLVSVQEYAAAHLGTQGRFSGSGTAARKLAESRHWRYFSGLAEQAAVADRCVEIDNLVAACRRAAAGGDATSSVDALVNAWAALKLCGPFRGAVELAAVVIGMPSLRAGQRAVVAWVSGSARYMLGEVSDAHSRFDDGLELARVAGNRRCEAQLLCALGDQLTTEGRTDEAHSALKRALESARELGDAALECKALNGLGALFNDVGRPGDARIHYQAALDLARKLGDRRWEGGLFNNLGILHHGQGHLDDARQHYEQSLALASETGDRRWEGNTRCNLGLLHYEQGRHQEARMQFEAALIMARQLGHTRLESTVLCNLGMVVEEQGQFDEARVHYESAVRAARELRERRSEGQFRSYLGLLYARLGRFDDSRSCLDIGERLLGEVSDPISLGLLLCKRAEAEHLGGGTRAAATALTRAEALLIESAAGGDSELGRSVAALHELVD